MTVAAPEPNGLLRIEVETNSYFLSNSLPAVVRDAHVAVFARLTSGATKPLAPGLYSVAAVTPDGAVVVRHIHIERHETTTVVFEPPADAESAGQPGGPLRPEQNVILENTDGCV